MDVTTVKVVLDWTYKRPLLACRFDPKGRFVLTSAEDNLLQRFNMADGKATALPATHDSWVQALAVSPSGNISISGGGDGRLVWWDSSADDIKPIRTVDAHQSWVRSVSISADEKWLVSGGYDRIVKLWDLSTGQLARQWQAHEMNVYSVQFLPDNRRLVSGDLKGMVQLWDIEQDQPLKQFDAAALHSYNGGQRVNFGGVRALAINPQMTEIIAGGLHKASNPLGAVHEPLALRFSLDEAKLVNTHAAEGIPGGGLWRTAYLTDDVIVGVSGGSTGGFLLFWKTGTDLTLHKFQLPALARDMDVSPDKKRIATAHYDRHLRISEIS